MKVTAALAWWNESVSDLERCVRGMASIADRVVAFDGSYRRYPNATPASPQEQAETISRVANECGMECSVLVPDRLWAGQVEKRSALMREAVVGSDWVVIVDADHVISADREKARAYLENVPGDVDAVSVVFASPDKEDSEYATGWHRDVAGTTSKMVQVIRAFPDLHVEKFHWMYYATKNGQRVEIVYGSRSQYVIPGYEVRHMFVHRDEQHIRDSRAFCNDRVMVVNMTGQEDDVAGLPDPVYDYDTVPY